jgi:hypothetical protein
VLVTTTVPGSGAIATAAREPNVKLSIAKPAGPLPVM